jgi:hypothetical protein
MVDVTTDQNFPNAAVDIKNAKGESAKVDGAPVWASSDETVVTATASADGLSAVVNTVAPGLGRITVTADADLGAGVKTLTIVSEDINVTLGTSQEASVLSFSLGAPADKA